jgi:hypothetical protein
MRLLALAALAAAAVVTPPAGATGGPPQGAPCDFDVLQWWPVTGPDDWTGVIHGGPVAAPGTTLTLTCEIHVGNDLPSGPAAVTATAGPTAHAAAVVPEQASYVASPDELVAMCTEATVDGTSWYWTGDGWTTDSTVPCPHASSVDLTTFCMVDLIWCLVFYLNEVVVEHVDPTVCPVLAAARPGLPGVVDVDEQGDVYVFGERFWDCLPYAET